MDIRARGAGLETCAPPYSFLMYGMSAQPLIEYGFHWFFVVPLVPHRDCFWGSSLVPSDQPYAQSGKFCS